MPDDVQEKLFLPLRGVIHPGRNNESPAANALFFSIAWKEKESASSYSAQWLLSLPHLYSLLQMSYEQI